MRLRSAARAAATIIASASVVTAPASALAGGHQFHAGPTFGGFWSSGPSGGAGGLVGVSGGYGITDAFRWYANVEYTERSLTT